MGKQHRGLFEIRFRAINGKNGGRGPEKSFLATLSKGTLEAAQAKCHGGIVTGIKKTRDRKGNKR